MLTKDDIRDAKAMRELGEVRADPVQPYIVTTDACFLIAGRALDAYANILERLCWNDGTAVTVEQVVFLRRIVEGE